MKAATSVQSYLATLRPEVRRHVKKLRDVIRATAPDAVESISYGIPTYKLDGRPLVYCAGFKDHTSMYPLTPGVRRALGADLEKHESGKGTIRFPLTKDPSATFVKRIVRARIAEIRAKNKM